MPEPQLLTFSPKNITTKAAENIADLIIEQLRTGQLVNLFLSGGSAIAMYLETFQRLQQELTALEGEKLHLALVDERFGPYGHLDSNETQLRQKGVLQIADKLGAKFSGILQPHNPSLEETLTIANQAYTTLLSNTAYQLALFGLGNDGHTAGWLPTQTAERFSQLYSQKQPVVYYKVATEDSSNPYRQRLTMSTTTLPQIDQVIVYTKGENKKAALGHLMANDRSVHQTPALILREAVRPIIILTDQRYDAKN